MITYKKHSLRVYNILGGHLSSYVYSEFNHQILEELKRFIESGDYKRIVDIVVLTGDGGRHNGISVIYEVSKKEKS